MYISPVSPVAIMLTRSLPARTPLWSLENNSIYLKKQQFLCEEMGLLRTCSMHWRRFFPFQVIGFFFLKAGKVTLRQGEQVPRRARVWSWVRHRAASAGITGIGVGERKRAQKAVVLLNREGLWVWGSQVSNSHFSWGCDREDRSECEVVGNCSGHGLM